MTSPRTLHLIPRDRLDELVDQIDAALAAPSFTPTRAQPVPEWLERGVHIAPWLDQSGNPVVVAIGANHRVVCWQPWLPGQTYEQVTAGLADMLDASD